MKDIKDIVMAIMARLNLTVFLCMGAFILFVLGCFVHDLKGENAIWGGLFLLIAAGCCGMKKLSQNSKE